MSKSKEEKKMCPDHQFCDMAGEDCIAKKSLDCIPVSLGEDHERVLYVCIATELREKGSYHYGDKSISFFQELFITSGGDKNRGARIEDMAVDAFFERKRIAAENEKSSNSSEGGQVLQLIPA